MPASPLTPVRNPETQWAKVDRQTVVHEHPTTGQEQVDHARSAGANLKEVGKNVVDAFTPNHLLSLRGPSGDYGDAFKALVAPWMLAADVADVVTLPFKVAKNAADAVAHGAKAAADKVMFWK